MNKKRLLIIGVIGLVVGLILIAILGSKLAEANDFLDLSIEMGHGLKTINAWSENVNHAKFGVGVGAVFALVFGCFFIVGLCTKKVPGNTGSISDRLETLELAKKNGLITQEEYEKKRDEVLSEL